MTDPWLSGLEDGEHRFVMRLYEAPSLWAFALLASELGVERAVELCGGQADIPEEALALLRQGAYGPEHLPEQEKIRYAILGCRASWRRRRGDPIAVVCKSLGATRVDILHGQAAEGHYNRRRYRISKLRGW